MRPLFHIILGGIFSLIIFLIFPSIKLFGALIVFISSILLDLDHYIYFIWKKKQLSLVSSYSYFVKQEKFFLSLPRKKRNSCYGFFPFLHGVEVLIFLSIGSIFWKPLIFILIGISFHLILDQIYLRTIMDRWDRVSIIVDFVKFKKLKKIE